MMKAAIRSACDPPEVLSIREVPVRIPKDNQLLIRIHAATVNRTDCGALWGKPYIFRFFCGMAAPASCQHRFRLRGCGGGRWKKTKLRVPNCMHLTSRPTNTFSTW